MAKNAHDIYRLIILNKDVNKEEIVNLINDFVDDIGKYKWTDKQKSQIKEIAYKHLSKTEEFNSRKPFIIEWLEFLFPSPNLAEIEAELYKKEQDEKFRRFCLFKIVQTFIAVFHHVLSQGSIEDFKTDSLYKGYESSIALIAAHKNQDLFTLCTKLINKGLLLFSDVYGDLGEKEENPIYLTVKGFLCTKELREEEKGFVAQLHDKELAKLKLKLNQNR